MPVSAGTVENHPILRVNCVVVTDTEYMAEKSQEKQSRPVRALAHTTRADWIGGTV